MTISHGLTTTSPGVLNPEGSRQGDYEPPAYNPDDSRRDDYDSRAPYGQDESRPGDYDGYRDQYSDRGTEGYSSQPEPYPGGQGSPRGAPPAGYPGNDPYTEDPYSRRRDDYRPPGGVPLFPNLPPVNGHRAVGSPRMS